MNPYVENPLADWEAAIKLSTDLITNPEDGWRKLVALAKLARRRNQVSAEEYSEMLELTDAARLWALTEWEEAHAAGLFLDEPDTSCGSLPLYK